MTTYGHAFANPAPSPAVVLTPWGETVERRADGYFQPEHLMVMSHGSLKNRCRVYVERAARDRTPIAAIADATDRAQLNDLYYAGQAVGWWTEYAGVAAWKRYWELPA